MDGQSQVVVTVLQVQDAGLLDQLSSKLLLQLHHLLQCPRWLAEPGGQEGPPPPPLHRARGTPPSVPGTWPPGGRWGAVP